MEIKNFVKTSDEKTAEYLRKAGFIELAQEDNKWVFLNETEQMNFSSDDDLKLYYTDILCV